MAVFVTHSRSVHVLLAGLLVLAILAAGTRAVIRDDLAWFWTVTVVAAGELLVVAAWDLLADLTDRLPYLIVDQDVTWPPWAHALLVPAFLFVGIALDHFLVH